MLFRSKVGAHFDTLLQKALMVSQIAKKWPDKEVIGYTDQIALETEEVLPTVLIIEDEGVQDKAVIEALRQHYTVRFYQVAADAIDEVVRVIICHVAQQSERCIYLIETLQKGEGNHTPILVLQEEKDVLLEAKVIAYERAYYMAKPYTPQSVATLVTKVFQQIQREVKDTYNKDYEMILQYQANQLKQSEIDPLTELYNDNGFYQQVHRKLIEKPQGHYTILRWDIDHFKIINERFGIDEGNALLKYMASITYCAYGEHYLIARLTSDHFVMLIDESLAVTPLSVLDCLQEGVKRYPLPFKILLHMGVYEVKDPHMEVSLMGDRTLLALRTVKGSFANRIGYYSDLLHNQVVEEQELSGDMEEALKRREFVVYFQPQVDYAAGKIVGAEALVRWQHPQKGMMAPGRFIPLFERNGLINVLDYYIWEETCQYIARWQKKYTKKEPLPIAVNISRSDVYNEQLCESLVTLTKRYNISKRLLKLEITESAYMENGDQLIEQVKAFREAGFSVSMDDFGSGYSSLNTLKDVPVDVLKLDMKFLSRTEHDTRGNDIIRSIIQMAKILNLTVITEGVETKVQADFIKSLGCPLMQGYFFSKPLPAEDYEAFFLSRDEN